MRTTATQEHTALGAFVAILNEIDAHIAAIKAVSADHLGTHPDAINWGHVGSAKRALKLLREARETLGASVGTSRGRRHATVRGA